MSRGFTQEEKIVISNALIEALITFSKNKQN